MQVLEPHQPQAPKHWPEPCEELWPPLSDGNRSYSCPICWNVESRPEDEMRGRVMMCYGNGVATVREEA